MPERGSNIRKVKSSKLKVQSLDKKNSELKTQNSKLILILGGARSGKSAYALRLSDSFDGQKAYIATAEALDAEMAEKIERHRKERGNEWKTIEEPIRIVQTIQNMGDQCNLILIDCLTLWLSNLLHLYDGDGKKVMENLEALIIQLEKTDSNIIVVSNEVGLGIVPDNPLARRFRDITGLANQRLAEIADEVTFVIAGRPMRLK